MKAHRPRQKSDRRDAFELCEGLRRGLYRAIVHVPPARIGGAARDAVAAAALRGRAGGGGECRQALAAGGGAEDSSARSLATEAAWAKLLAALANEPALRTYVTQHHALWRCVQEQLAALETTLAAQPAAITTVATRLQTVPGVGPIVSLTTVAVFSDCAPIPEREARGELCGLGTVDRSIRGPRHPRPHHQARLGRVAHHAVRSRASRPATNPPPPSVLRAPVRAARLQDGGRRGRPSPGRILFALLRDGTEFDVRQLAIEEGPFRRTTVQRYRLKRPMVRRA